MRTINTIAKGDMIAYQITCKREQIQTITESMELIIRTAGDYSAALEFLNENDIQTRLDDCFAESHGMRLLAELLDIRAELEGEVADLEYKRKRIAPPTT